MTVAEYAEAVGVKRQTVLRWIHRGVRGVGTLPATRDESRPTGHNRFGFGWAIDPVAGKTFAAAYRKLRKERAKRELARAHKALANHGKTTT